MGPIIGYDVTKGTLASEDNSRINSVVNTIPININRTPKNSRLLVLPLPT